jgi:peptide/nickel transport system ATP-binding protein
MTNVLRVQDLTSTFKTDAGVVTAVRDVSFEVGTGETLGIVGESGSGKSVTALSIMRLLPRTTGRIANGKVYLGDKELTQLPEEEMLQVRGKEISMIFQEPMTALNPVFTIGSQIDEVLELHTDLDKQARREKTIALLKQVRIPRAEEIYGEYPHQLSGGMRQRVMIAMAIACEPKLLIADEPTTALDVTIQAQILDLLRDLQQSSNMSTILITHDLSVIKEMTSRVLVMYGGRIVEAASVETLFARPSHPYTRGLMRSRPSLLNRGDELYSIPGMVPSLLEMPLGCAFAPRCDCAQSDCDDRIPELLEIEPDHFVRCCHIPQEVFNA